MRRTLLLLALATCLLLGAVTVQAQALFAKGGDGRLRVLDSPLLFLVPRALRRLEGRAFQEPEPVSMQPAVQVIAARRGPALMPEAALPLTLVSPPRECLRKAVMPWMDMEAPAVNEEALE